jgi:hypothetical protein
MSEEDYATETSKKVIADICGVIGYHGIKKNTMDILVDTLQKCNKFTFSTLVIFQIGERSSSYSNICGRNESNIHDVASSLKDLDLNFNQLYEYCHQFNADNLSAFDIGILFIFLNFKTFHHFQRRNHPNLF